MQVYIRCKMGSKQPSTKEHGETASEERTKGHRRFYDRKNDKAPEYCGVWHSGDQGSFPGAGLTARSLEGSDWKSESSKGAALLDLGKDRGRVIWAPFAADFSGSTTSEGHTDGRLFGCAIVPDEMSYTTTLYSKNCED